MNSALNSGEECKSRLAAEAVAQGSGDEINRSLGLAVEQIATWIRPLLALETRWSDFSGAD
jgi:hypothetical protein